LINDSRWRLAITGVLALALFAGCGGGAATEEEAGDTFGQSQQALHRSTPLGISLPYMEVPLVFPAGVAGGEKVVFIGSPFEGRVAAFSRFGEEPLGDLPPPEQGFILPFILKSTDSEVVTVLDAGGFPSPLPFVPANPILYEYEYSYNRSSGFSAELIRSIPFTGALIGFAEDAIRLDDGRYLVDDAVLGSIWIAETDGSITPGIVPETFEPEDAIDEMVFCDSMPLIEVGGVPFLFTGSTIPGIAAMAERDGTLYFSSACSGAVFSVPLAVFDDDRAPHERASDIELVSSKPDGVEVEQLLGLSFDPNRPDEPYLYAADTLQLRVIRINVETGERRIVGDDPTLFNFPSSLGFLPQLTRHDSVSTMVVVSNQQHLTPITNGAITEDMFEPPFLATKVLIPKGRGHGGRGHGHW
jgi:hypothetical protein